MSVRMDAQQLNIAVYNIMQTIPPQKVVSCGHVAKLLGIPKQARRVRQAVNFISHTTEPVPWHRVVSTSGVISTESSCPQQMALEKDGVEVYIGRVGESRVDLQKWGWFPEVGSVKLTKNIPVSNNEWGS
ncbi:hypothetical protein SERLA73DRAFT_184970 [Serpula lacrymans var. lacrymans S7.3]|uniref:Methylated-DNA-[protein]-cysteine S-methyltransferase DNA binding domain-containing protein n=2 Tax=Serpula lacrymans var. lacrymans TaxID=341189 RepID=F8Q3V3_SERL3|nr:uncharacterized protein SERLADRAFT_473174 [Serpula lacrymans var. lacrymans S7.9]EGN96809.1 hypothetical protein SERLA73DRAFT_184970 [Serpula lacrymans var. lacrymans S7.3]EGO22408.1 hypothetical protein SERLADRAFT_473174 [Serpula lacrymans var. lacrymans S7.9]